MSKKSKVSADSELGKLVAEARDRQAFIDSTARRHKPHTRQQKKFRHKKCIYPRLSRDECLKRARVVNERRGTLVKDAMLKHLEERPMTIAELAELVGYTGTRLRYYLNKLTDDGRVEYSIKKRIRTYRIKSS